MGLAQDLMRGVSGQAGAVATMRGISTTMEQQQSEWIAALRDAGVKAAHPDDGWVDRERNTVFFCYPQFDDGVAVGDLIALGWPQWNSKKPQHRIVRVTGLTGQFQQRWAFEPSNIQATIARQIRRTNQSNRRAPEAFRAEHQDI